MKQHKKYFLWGIFWALLLVPVPFAMSQDFSKAYKYGGGINIPGPGEGGGEREILDANVGIDAGGVLGCGGLDLKGMVDAQLGGLGAEQLGEDLVNAAQSKLFRATMSQVMANPQVASVMQNLKSTIDARVTLQQEKCDAAEIFANANNKRIQDESMQRCIREEGDMVECEKVSKRKKYAEEVLDSDKWTKSLHQQLCDNEDDEDVEGCDWLALVPDQKTVLDGEDPEKAKSDALMNSQDLRDMAIGHGVDMINERVDAAEAFVERFGYARAMEVALWNQPGLPPDIQQELDARNSDDTEIDASLLYTLYDHTSSKACSVAADRGFTVADLIKTQGSGGTSGGGGGGGGGDISGGDTSSGDASGGDTAVDTTKGNNPSNPSASPPPTSGNNGGGNGIVFPVSGKTTESIRVTSPYGPRTCSKCSSNFHGGVDYGVGTGTTLVSSIRGTVTTAHFSRCGGNMVIVKGGGVEIKYMHMSQFAGGISAGITIDAGTTVGASGNTGSCTTGPHLHFETRLNGTRVNPHKWLGGSSSVLAEALRQTGSHGRKSLAATRLGEDVSDDFLVKSHEMAAKLGERVINTVECNVSKSLHPHVFVAMAVLPGTTGPFSMQGAHIDGNSRGLDLAKSLATGDKGSITHGLARVFGHHAVVTAMTATIHEMSAQIAATSHGEGGMNKPLYNTAIGELGRLKFERFQVVQEYKAQCKLISRVADIYESRQQRMDDFGRSSFELKGVQQEPLNCEIFDHIRDDGLKEITQFARRTDEDVEKMRQQAAQ